MASDQRNEPARRNAKGQFLKGETANRNGRPPKVARAYLPSQFTHDVIMEMEAPVTLQKANGKTEVVPYAIAAIRTMKAEVLTKRDFKQFTAMMDMYMEALAQNALGRHEVIGAMKGLESQLPFAETSEDRRGFTKKISWWRGLTKPI